MKTSVRAASFVSFTRKEARHGFAMAELIVVFVVMGVATMLVSGLMSQILKVGQRSAQTGAILELRNRVNVISKNPGPWLEKMRAKHALYSACIPDSNAATFASNVFRCPDVGGSDRIKNKDSTLGKVAGSQLHISSAPVVDYMGESLAGTEDEPVYLDASGRVCENSDSSKCPFKSTGYFMRTNPSGNQNPGDIRFVVKVEKNLASLSNGNTGLFKPEYLTVEVGQSWMESKGSLDGSLKVGYRLDGNPLYVKAGLSCSGTQVLTGIGADGKAECKSVPTGCESGKGMLDPQTSELVCSQSSECGAGQIFLGHYAGTGQAICSSATMSCQANQVQVGVRQSGSTLVADCKELPSCNDSQQISYDGSQFQCVADILAKTCPENQVMVGTNEDGSLNCKEADRSIASDDLECDDGFYVFAIKKDGSVRCKPFPQATPIVVVPPPPPPPASGPPVLFLSDISSSMKKGSGSDTRLSFSNIELNQLIKALTPNTLFNVTYVSDKVAYHLDKVGGASNANVELKQISWNSSDWPNSTRYSLLDLATLNLSNLEQVVLNQQITHDGQNLRNTFSMIEKFDPKPQEVWFITDAGLSHPNFNQSDIDAVIAYGVKINVIIIGSNDNAKIKEVAEGTGGVYIKKH